MRPFPFTAQTGAVLLAALLTACGGDGDGGVATAPPEAPPPAAPEAPPLTAAQSRAWCEGLPAAPGLANTTVTTVYHAEGTRRPGNAATGDFLPGHCVVEGRIDPRVGTDGKNYYTGFRLSLPDNFNGRFLYLGGGGNDGSLADTSRTASISGGTPSPLGQGFAVVSTDAGHQGGTAASFGAEAQARIDHAYAAHDKTAQAARSLIASRYGKPAAHSYFAGCSGGGRQGMMFSQRFPDYFDGIIAGAPAMRVSSGATIAAMWNNVKFTAAAPTDGSGAPILSQALSITDLDLLADAILQKCDAADGAADGMVSRTNSCTFDPAVLQCAGAKTDTCLSAQQVNAVKEVFAGPRNSFGTALYFGQPWDAGIRAPGWRAWTLGSSTTATPNSAYNTLMSDALRNEFFTPPDPAFNVLAFDFDRDPLRMEAFSQVYDTFRDTTLAAYRAHGGKLMIVHGMADPIFSATESQRYYDQLVVNNGGLAATKQFARAFYVPGMNHCSGGPATDNFDAIQAMVDWVEKGSAPDRIAARALPTNAFFPNRSRPLCPYPQFAKYKGTGSVEDAGNFTCSDS
ncbi:tannase/feruloyl esterase family alpha/beta hydrolase [Ramlibacter sp. USB13]|uniref:Tannase/feruloyl esterase family alpha/beta hydrolase n=1 Tax=Ramlibacter cellulosilyticus TaxID=2764187 RepID=A0A923MMI5_9BURK|nr:tannase/feruloyl esterase family alpha/beta hydrolase [Ramlibacter cellulosilyticus]MBC5782090.1 tannase/feruloyl esterase family alpha/beta hydrolase [Ramlibacter cellulosilyticus]